MFTCATKAFTKSLLSFADDEDPLPSRLKKTGDSFCFLYFSQQKTPLISILLKLWRYRFVIPLFIFTPPAKSP